MLPLSDKQTSLMLQVFSSLKSLTGFVDGFKEVQRNKIKLDQMGIPLPNIDEYHEQCAVYLNVANICHQSTDFPGFDYTSELNQIDFELVLFTNGANDLASVFSDVARYTRCDDDAKGSALKSLIHKITCSGYLMGESELLLKFINQLGVGELKDDEVALEYKKFLAKHQYQLLCDVACSNDINPEALKVFYEKTLMLMVVDDECAADLFSHHDLGWKERIKKVNALMGDLLDVFRLAVNLRDIRKLGTYF